MTSRELRREGLPRARVASIGLAVLIGLALPSAGVLASDPSTVLYQWTDEQGNVRYTPDPDRVPSGQRATLQRLEPGMPPTSAPGRPVAAPTEPAPPPQQPPPAASVTPAPVDAPSAATAAVEVPDATAATLRAPNAAAAPVAVPSDAPRSESRPAASPSPPPPAADATREQQLIAAIAADQEALKAMLAAPPIPGETARVDSPQLREIALRLPELQAELRALRERQTPPAGP